MKKGLSLFLFLLIGLNIFAQNSGWSADPMVNNLICGENSTQTNPSICTDGKGGGIAVWIDGRYGSKSIYTQRISSNGSLLWTPGGEIISSSVNTKWPPTAISDGVGGAYLVWTEGSSWTRVHAQRVDSLGNILWVLNGVQMNQSYTYQHPQVMNDGMGNLLIAYKRRQGALNFPPSIGQFLGQTK